MDLLLLILVGSLVITSVFTLETDNRTYTILLLLLFSIMTGIAFIYVGALFSGIFQLIIYAGVMTTLFVATIYMVNETGDEFNDTPKEVRT